MSFSKPNGIYNTLVKSFKPKKARKQYICAGCYKTIQKNYMYYCFDYEIKYHKWCFKMYLTRLMNRRKKIHGEDKIIVELIESFLNGEWDDN